MSEVTTLARPVPHSVALESNDRSIDTSLVHSFSFSGQRWRSGLAQAASGMFLAVTGVFLLAQIGSTPGLVTQLAILGSLCSIGGVALLTKAARDLFGRLMIDENGIAVRPSVTGFAISWNELKRWDVRLDGQPTPDSPSLRFWTQGDGCPLFIPSGWLSDRERDQIRHAMYAYAGDKCLGDRHSVGQ